MKIEYISLLVVNLIMLILKLVIYKMYEGAIVLNKHIFCQ